MASEPDSCGQRLLDAEGCHETACSACAAFTQGENTCAQLAAQSLCKAYSDAADAACGALADAGASVDASCLPDSTIADPAQQERDFVTRLATFFCGPP